MSAPESSAAEQSAAMLRAVNDAGGTIGSALLRAVQVLRREHFENEARDLENALQLLARLVASGEIPEHLRDSVDAYVETARDPGGFVEAVLENDLRSAYTRGDEMSRRALPTLLKYLSTHVPLVCWGSPDTVRAWRSLTQEERDGMRAF